MRLAVAFAPALASLLLLLAGMSCSSGDGPPPASPSNGSPSPAGEERLLPVLEPVRLAGAATGDQSGAIAAGDFNGDGSMDVVLGAAFSDGADGRSADAGAAHVFLGPFQPGETRDAGALEQELSIYGATAGDQLGRSVAAGDFDGDGVDDIVLGSPFSDGPAGDRVDAGRVDVVRGSPDIGQETHSSEAVAALASLTVFGATAGDLAGFSVATGRLNGDDYADVLIGAFWADGTGDSRDMAGEVYALLGGAGRAGVVDLAAMEADVTVYGAAAADRLGEGVASGDVDGDGLDDLVLPAPFAVNLQGVRDSGRTYVITSPPPAAVDLAAYTPAATIYGVDDGDQLGHITATGDADGDGHDDVLLTAVSADGPENTIDLAGEGLLFLSTALAGSVEAQERADVTVYGRDREDRLGRSAVLADVDGDGRAEIVLGAPGGGGPEGDAPLAGEVYVLAASGEAVRTAPGKGFVYYGEDAGDGLSSEIFGRNPLVAADMNGDGRDELLIVAPLGDGVDNQRLDCGEAVILFITTENGG